MDIALQNFDVHAFRAAFQMVNVLLFQNKHFIFFNVFIYTLDISLCFMFGHSSFILMFNIILQKGLEYSALADEYVFLFT